MDSDRLTNPIILKINNLLQPNQFYDSKCLYPNSALLSNREGKVGWMDVHARDASARSLPRQVVLFCAENSILQRNMGEPLSARWRWSESRWVLAFVVSARSLLAWGNQCRPSPYLKWRVNSLPREKKCVRADTASPHLWWIRHSRDSAGRRWKGEVGQSRQRHRGIHLLDQTNQETAVEGISDLLHGWYAE